MPYVIFIITTTTKDLHVTEEKTVPGGQWLAQGHPAKVSGGADT